MPAVLILMSKDNPQEDPSLPPFVAGEIVTVAEQDHQFGFKEMPLKFVPDKTVAQINATPVGNLPLYGTVRVLDAGTITIGTQGDLPVVAGDVLVWQFKVGGNYFRNYGDRPLEVKDYYHLRVSDKTVSEAVAYIAEFNKALSYKSDLYQESTGLRRFTTTNVNVSVSGNNGFVQADIDQAIAFWNEDHPENTVTIREQGTDYVRKFQCEGIMPVELFDEWKFNTQSIALQSYYAQRRWRINAAGLAFIASHDGVYSGTAADIAPYLEDGLLA